MIKLPRGFTLLEALITLAIVGFLTVSAVSAWGPFIATKRINIKLEEIYHALKLIHSESFEKHTIVTMSFRENKQDPQQWCFGLSEQGDCNCMVADRCRVDGVDTAVHNTSPVTISINGLSGVDKAKYINFESVRGMSSNYGQVELSSSGYKAQIQIGALGSIRRCSNQISNLAKCHYE